MGTAAPDTTVASQPAPTPAPASRGERLYVVDALRGIASLSVAWYHITGAGAFVPELAVLTPIARYSWLGVQIFFVISGFILPLSLYRARYQIGSYGRFLAKRVIRIDPPYLLTVFLKVLFIVAVGRVPGLAGPTQSVNWTAVLGHIAFLNAFTGQPWLNVVFWTLAIEFQYYLLIGLVFPLLVSPSWFIRGCLATGFLLAPLISHSPSLLPLYASLFLMGIVTFQYKAAIFGRKVYLALLLVAAITSWFLINPESAIIGVLAALAIAFIRIALRPLQWLGTISYSLYLVHGFVSSKPVAWARAHFPQTALSEWLVALTALGLSLAIASVFYRFVEEPAREAASRVAWRPKPVVPTAS